LSVCIGCKKDDDPHIAIELTATPGQDLTVSMGTITLVGIDCEQWRDAFKYQWKAPISCFVCLAFGELYDDEGWSSSSHLMVEYGGLSVLF
jgi:hypothetical protein